MTRLSGRAGWGLTGSELQAKSTRLFSTATSCSPAESSLSERACQALAPSSQGSTPTPPVETLLHSHSAWLGVSGSPSFISVQLWSISWLACRWYRPSVHSRAWLGVMMAVPADPVKPDTASLRASMSARYSELCASQDGTM